MKQISSTINSLSMLEHFYTCPYCWEEISALLDPSISNQTYIEDCEVCCRPIEVRVSVDDDGMVAVDAWGQDEA